MLIGILAASFGGCGAGGGKVDPRQAELDRKLERLLAIILESEQKGAQSDDSLRAEANQIIAELGGADSTADRLAARLLDNADRWIPILDSLARPSATAPRIPAG